MVRLDGNSTEVIMADCSLTGIHLKGDQAELKRLFFGKSVFSQFEISFQVSESLHSLCVELARMKANGEGELSVGLRVLKPNQMVLMLSHLQNLRDGRSQASFLDFFWVKKGFRYTLLMLWAASMSGSFIVPCCGKQNFQPYHIEGTEALSTDELTSMHDAIDIINRYSGTTLIDADPQYQGGYKVFVSFGEPPPGKVGNAHVTLKSADVVLHSSLADPAVKSKRTAVFVHEFGHCLGLSHSLDEKDIMYNYQNPIDEYSEDKLRDFGFRIRYSEKYH